jgi:hypothetical protein
MTGEHDSSGARCFRDRGHAGVVLAAAGIVVAVGIIAELGQHPGGEDRSEPRLARVDLSVRVLAKTQPHLLFQHSGLGDHLGDHGDQRRHGDGIDGLQPRSGRQLLGPQRGNDLTGPSIEVALAARLAEQTGHLSARQVTTPLRLGSSGENSQRVPAGEVVTERDQRCRVELPQQRTQRAHRPLPGPDHGLMRPGRQPQALSDHRVTSRGSVMSPVQSDDLGEHMSIARIRLRPSHAVAVTVASGLQRVDRIHGVTGRDQRLHPRAAVGLDADQHLVRLVILTQILSNKCVQGGQTDHPLGEPASSQHTTTLIDQLDIMMGFSPVIPHEQHHRSPLLDRLRTVPPSRREEI